MVYEFILSRLTNASLKDSPDSEGIDEPPSASTYSHETASPWSHATPAVLDVTSVTFIPVGAAHNNSLIIKSYAVDWGEAKVEITK